MNNAISPLSKAVFNKSSIESCSLVEIKTLADKYPYFAAIQVLLSAKFKENKEAGFKSQLQKTSLFITNPFWLDGLINPEKYLHDEGNMKTTVLETEHIIEETIELVEPTEVAESESSIFKFTLPELNKTVSADDELPLSFEPYHRVDYFASQGIKLEAEVLKDDKLSQKLKSFTDWLKVMKKLPELEKLNSMDTGSELKVITLAEHSISDREILTESMAEVWVKQGIYEKAIETYQKLSLLDPSKSAYFASKIENLKK